MVFSLSDILSFVFGNKVGALLFIFILGIVANFEEPQLSSFTELHRIKRILLLNFC